MNEEIKKVFPRIQDDEIPSLISDIKKGRVEFINPSDGSPSSLLFKAGARVPATVMKGVLAVSANQLKDDAAKNPATCQVSPLFTAEARECMAEILQSSAGEKFQHPVLLLGEGPFVADEIAQFLTISGFSALLNYENYDLGGGGELMKDAWGTFWSAYPPIVVLGRSRFDSTAFRSLFLAQYLDKEGHRLPASFPHWIKCREDGKGGHFYLRSQSLETPVFISQEMLLASIFSRQASIPKPSPFWEKHVAKHPGLSLVREIRENRKNVDECFIWPVTHAEPGHRPIGDTNWPKIGMLKYFGYSVGENGICQTDRHRILRGVFLAPHLPKVDSEEYVMEWSSPESGGRLKKMANAIATFCRKAYQRQDPSMEQSIDDWEVDLAWLKINFYNGKFDRQFTWPESRPT